MSVCKREKKHIQMLFRESFRSDMIIILLQVCKKRKILERWHREKTQLWIYASRMSLLQQIIFHAVISVLHHRPPRPPVGFWALITTRTRCPVQPPEAGREEIMAPAERSLVPPTGRRLIPHHQPIHPWPPLPASFAKYSFCCVQVVAGGGVGVVRSRYSQKGWSVEWRGGCVWGSGVRVGMGGWEGLPSESICTQRHGSLWSPRLHLPR